MEGLDRVKSFKERAPNFLTRFIESREAFVPLLLICIALLVGDGYQLLLKEMPEVPKPPVIEIKAPIGPTMTITRINPPMKEQCWMQNIAMPPPRTIPLAQSTMETLMFCNYERKAPLFLVVDYDKPPILYGTVLFPEGRHISMQEHTTEKRIFLKVDSPSILPYQVFLVTVYGGDEKPPTATKIQITPINPER